MLKFGSDRGLPVDKIFHKSFLLYLDNISLPDDDSFEEARQVGQMIQSLAHALCPDKAALVAGALAMALVVESNHSYDLLESPKATDIKDSWETVKKAMIEADAQELVKLEVRK